MRIKILDKDYRVVNYIDVTSNPCDVCSVGDSEVAITLNCGKNMKFSFSYLKMEH
ncbi:hypothetical protein DPMN_086988 [Dreissena polymorpha]|uniref:Uncharacterized protein n=1 Tax=Dreissena polymorpha TaxID=45954 RepID=A0A9D4QV28_DREPO|nr:hypothetical protein DPMN_086988 [Dreissena polymorpha]